MTHGKRAQRKSDMIYFPLSTVYRDAATVAYERCLKEYSPPADRAKIMRSFIAVAYKEVCYMTSIMCLVFSLALVLCNILHHEAGPEITFLYACVTMMALALLSVNLILNMQLAFVIPPYIACYHPLSMKSYMLHETRRLVQGIYYAIAIGVIALLFSLLDSEIWSQEQKPVLYAVYFFIGIGTLWYSFLSLRAYVVLNDSILAKKKENEEWLRKNGIILCKTH